MKKVIVLFQCLWLVGCATTNVSLFNPQKQYAPVGADQVAIYLLERDIPANAERLGTVAVEFALTYSDADLQRDVKAACAKIGATGAFRINEGTRPIREGYYQVNYLAFRTLVSSAL